MAYKVAFHVLFIVYNNIFCLAEEKKVAFHEAGGWMVLHSFNVGLGSTLYTKARPSICKAISMETM